MVELQSLSDAGPIEWQWNTSILDRAVRVDLYLPPGPLPENCPLLLVNDGQDLCTMQFEQIIGGLWREQAIGPLLVAAVHAGKDRRMEYGTIGEPDYLGRGSRAGAYRDFILEECLPRIAREYPQVDPAALSLAGFSLGGLSAMDLVWQHPERFSSVGVFSGSFWWRSMAQEDPLYSDDHHRILHQRIRRGAGNTNQRYFFQCGAMDEQMDRNRNGIIDSIDDTLDLIEELVRKGVSRSTQIYYLELADGKHDISSWARAFPFFLRWNYTP